MPTLTVRYFAAARAAAGVREEAINASSVAEAVRGLRARHSAHFAQVLDGCSLLLDGVHVDPANLTLCHDGELDVLPPFAGG